MRKKAAQNHLAQNHLAQGHLAQGHLNFDALRIGHGSDVHQLVSGRRCVIGGVEFPDAQVGPDGHSDGDVLLHAVMDALLGATGRPDIGQRYPPADTAYKNADSSLLLSDVWAEISGAGFAVINIDCTIICELPKIAPRRVAIQARIAQLLGISVECVGVKATTAEKLGALGRGEGIFASAVVLLVRS